jgi:hypothetical protein
MPRLVTARRPEFGDWRCRLRELCEVVDAEPREGDRGYGVIELEDGETPVLGSIPWRSRGADLHRHRTFWRPGEW